MLAGGQGTRLGFARGPFGDVWASLTTVIMRTLLGDIGLHGDI